MVRQEEVGARICDECSAQTRACGAAASSVSLMLACTGNKSVQCCYDAGQGLHFRGQGRETREMRRAKEIVCFCGGGATPSSTAAAAAAAAGAAAGAAAAAAAGAQAAWSNGPPRPAKHDSATLYNHISVLKGCAFASAWMPTSRAHSLGVFWCAHRSI